MSRELLKDRALMYATRRRLSLAEVLGTGVQGSVWALIGGTLYDNNALKIHEHEIDYARERYVYLRHREYGVSEILGCEVPLLIDYDNELLPLK